MEFCPKCGNLLLKSRDYHTTNIIEENEITVYIKGNC